MQVQLTPLTEVHRDWVHRTVGAPTVLMYGQVYSVAELDGYVGVVEGRPLAFALYTLSEHSLNVVILSVPQGFVDMLGWLCSVLEKTAKRRGLCSLRLVLVNPAPDLLGAVRQLGFRVAAFYPGVSENRHEAAPLREMWDMEKPLVYRSQRSQ